MIFVKIFRLFFPYLVQLEKGCLFTIIFLGQKYNIKFILKSQKFYEKIFYEKVNLIIYTGEFYIRKKNG